MRFSPIACIVTIALALGCLSGCTVTTTTSHTLASSEPDEVLAGDCAPVSGPFHLPSGATTHFIVSAVSNSDDMDVAVIEDSLGCDFANGDGNLVGIASASGGTGSLPSGNYDFVVQCHNVAAPCDFDLTWTADY